MFQARRDTWGDRGFTLIEMTVAMVVFAVIGLAVYGVLVKTNQSKQMGSSIADAQQNARMALDTILRDLREAGYGISPVTQVPIETASQYRVTFVVDSDEDGVTDPGERVTYFLDPDQSDPVVVATANPDDYLLRRIISDAADPTAAPGPGKGTIVAYGVTQRTPQNAGWNVPLFDYFDAEGNSILGTADDPDDSEYGVTVPDSLLGVPIGSGWNSAVRTVQVQVVVEASQRDTETQDFRQVRVSGRIHPRNIGVGGRKFFSPNGEYDPGAGGGGTDTTGVPPDTTGVPPDTTEVELPPEEPPIRIPTERVLSLTLSELHERDSQEGSAVTEDHRHDLDIMIGTQSGGTNNLAVWFEGWPDKYSGRLYNSVANYHGYSAWDINHLVTGELDGDTHGVTVGGGLLPVNEDQYIDLVAAVATGAFTGGFEVWLNQDGSGRDGHLGIGSVTTTANAYYSQTSGRGKAIGLADFNLDGDLDVVLGTNTGANAGQLEIWSNFSGTGTFIQRRVMTASGDVNAVAVGDFDGDGWPDVAAGTKTSNSNRAGQVEVWLNRTQSGTAYDFARTGPWDSRGQVKALAAGSMNSDGYLDLVAGTQTGPNSGEVELWLNDGSGSLSIRDYAAADDVVLSVAVGEIDYASSSLDIVAGTAARSVQTWFCDPAAMTASGIIPAVESWADANTGGLVNAVAVAKVQASRDDPSVDLLNDIVCGTAINTTSGEIVIYLNPYVWTLPDTAGP